jgi:2'-5' RNA ligase
MKTIRAFIAIELTDELKQSILALIHTYQGLVPAGLVKWVATRNLHLTIKFLGDTPINLIPSIQEKMDQLAFEETGFWMTAAGAGMFPSARKPRVVWLGLDCKTELSEISKRLDNNLSELQIAREEHPFSPHLTVGRVYQGLQDEKFQKLGDIILRNQPGVINKMFVRNIRLIKSDLRPEGPEYSTIHSAELREVLE